MRRSAGTKVPAREKKTFLHLEVNEEARRLFRSHAVANGQTMTEILHRFICKTIGRDDLPAPTERTSA